MISVIIKSRLPEPSTVLLLESGLVGFIGARRKLEKIRFIFASSLPYTR
ncbi:PEP-CTERM sorting domain-containing protein [Thermodesulfobacteriota bacterium]